MRYYYFSYSFVKDGMFGSNGYGCSMCAAAGHGQFLVDHWRRKVNKDNGVECVILWWTEITKEQYEDCE